LDGNHGELYPRAEEFSDEGVPYIAANDFVDGVVDFSNCKHLPQERAKKFRKGVAKDGDVLFAHNATVGPTAILRTELPYVILSTTATYFRCDPDSIARSFLRASLQADYFVRQYTRVMSQSTRNQVPISMQRKFSLQLPTLPEQQKIADFLTAVDGRIGQLIQKKALLEAYKKGVMQQLFTQAIRFKDKVNGEARENALGCDHGNDFPEWEEKKLGEVAEDIKSGLSLDQNSEGLGFKVTRIETISDRTINLEKIGYVQTNRNIEDFRLLPGDILFSNINSVSHIGKVAFVDQDYNLYQGMNLLRIRAGKKCSARFLFQLLKSTPFVRYFQRICNQAVSQASINQTDLKKAPISLPSLSEQTKIADFLTALDRKIESVATQITETQTFKRGLLQQMFV
jgi:type I restriction enzyme S subunit